MKLSIFRPFGLKTLYHASKLGFWKDFTPKMGRISKKLPKGTPLCESASFKPLIEKICRRVRPVGEFPERYK